MRIPTSLVEVLQERYLLMDKIPEQLIQLSDKLDKAGKTKCANVIDELIKHQSLTKVAQYVGVIGYVLKQNRAMGNCIRKKRASSTVPMQEIVLGCLREYQEGQQYDNTEWALKYAQVVQQFPDQFASCHVDFLETLAEENNMNQHMDRVKMAQNTLKQEDVQDSLINQIAFDLESLERVLKEGDADHRPFKVAAPPSQRNRWNRFWSPSWTRRGKDKDTQFEMDAVLESLTNIQRDVQQIRSGISQMRYQSRVIQNPTVQQHLQSLSDTNWEQTTNGLYGLQQTLGAAQQTDPTDRSILNLVQTSSQIDENIEQIFTEIRNVQENMYNLRLRDPVKGRGSLKSATEEYADLTRALDRLYINPLDERAMHYSVKLHGRLEDTLNERASALDPSYNQWVNAPESELGRNRLNTPGITPGIQSPIQTPSMTMDFSSIENSLEQMTDDPDVLSIFVNWLEQMTTFSTPNRPETKQAINHLLDLLREKQDKLKNVTEQPQSNVVQTGNEGGVAGNVATPSHQKLNDLFGDPNSDLLRDLVPNINTLLNPEKSGTTGSSLQKLTKIADVLNDWDSDLAELLREYIKEEKDCLPEFPSTSSIIKEQSGSRWKITQKKAGAVALST